MASRGGALRRLLVDRRAWVPSVGTPDVVDAAMARAFSPNAPRRRSFRVGASGGLTPVLATGNVSLETPAFCVWGANTAVGKTLVSAGLAAAARRRALPFLYLKPVQTGFPDDSDADFVATRARAGVVPTMGPHAAVAAGFSAGTNDFGALGGTEGVAHRGTAFPVAEGGGAAAASGPPFWAHTTFAWRRATGPQAAVAEEGRFVSDEELLRSVTHHLAQFADAVGGGGFGSSTGLSFGSSTDVATGDISSATSPDGFALVETAGGACSPGPSGSLQCDLMRPMRLPAVLVGDGQLGGISTTIAAYEALDARGYDVAAIILADGGHGNAAALARYCESVAPPSAGASPTPVFTLPTIPPRDVSLFATMNDDSSSGNEETRYDGSEIFEWLNEGKSVFDAALAHMIKSHAFRVSSLRSAPARAKRDLWWPFTQHDLVGDVTVIDSRSGEDFGVYVPDADASRPGAVHLRFDASASWWTQGVSKESARRLHRAAAAAAGRWGHVMFPENAHDAALDASRGLLDGAGKGWAKRVFFSDNGSTAMEVAVKMAMRLWYVRKGFVRAGGDAKTSDEALPQVRVLALDGSYHGDTLGTMDMQAPSVFTGPMQTPWYKPRGLFLSPPVAQMRRGRWVVAQPPDGLCLEKCHGCACDVSQPTGPGASETEVGFETREEVFDVEARSSSALAKRYREKIDAVLDAADAASAEDPDAHPPLAALVTECVLHGAGGMNLIDPLFQRVLMQRCKARGLPVVLDEVFAGIWRLGAEGAWQLLRETPDVSCYAKLLTGGLVPLAATATTEEVFDAFRGDTKAQGLLHGHSYTAYPVGCAVAAEAMRLYKDPEANPNLRLVEGKETSASSETGADAATGAFSHAPELRLRDLWDEASARDLSMLPNVKGVTVIGCVLAVELDDGGAGGYNSTATKELVSRLKRAASVQARPLGNVLYVMCAPTTSAERCAEIMAHVSREVQAAAMGDDDEAW
jgi:dethiobiotin synthetase/adenosylmethionine--8-amino-7-oxononanoate aminotransferase